MNKCSVILVLLLLTGCASIGTLELADSDRVRKYIADNIAVPEELVAKYGEPEQIFTKDNLQVYEYRRIQVSGFPDDKYSVGARHYHLDYVYVYFDDGILVQVENISRQGRYPPVDVFKRYLKTE